MNNLLFQIEPVTLKTCKDCVHRERHQCGSMVIQYCGLGLYNDKVSFSYEGNKGTVTFGRNVS